MGDRDINGELGPKIAEFLRQISEKMKPHLEPLTNFLQLRKGDFVKTRSSISVVHPNGDADSIDDGIRLYVDKVIPTFVRLIRESDYRKLDRELFAVYITDQNVLTHLQLLRESKALDPSKPRNVEAERKQMLVGFDSGLPRSYANLNYDKLTPYD